MNDKSGEIVGEQMRIAVCNQLESGELPFVNETFNRLASIGIDKDDAIRMMAHCMMLITFDILKDDAGWDPERYERMLQKLPDEETIYDV